MNDFPKMKHQSMSRSPRKCFLFISYSLMLALLACGDLAQAATYYVDQELGSDTNTGLASTASWKSLQLIHQTSFQPGDTILLKRGQIWRESMQVVSSGTESDPINVSTFGEGAPPILSGGMYVGRDAAWTNEGNGEWRLPLGASSAFSSIPIVVRGDGSHNPTTYQPLVKGEAVGSLGEDHFTTENAAGIRELIYRPKIGMTPKDLDFEVSHLTNPFIIQGDHVHVQGIDFMLASPWSVGLVLIRGQHSSVEDITARFSGVFGIVCDGAPFCRISNSLAEHNRSTGLYILQSTATDGLIEGSTSRLNGTIYFEGDRGGIGVQGARAKIINNRVEGNGNIHDQKNAGDWAISVFEASHVLVERNYVKNSAAGGILVSYSAQGYGSIIRNNVVNEYNLSNAQGTNKSSAISVAGYKNTEYSGLNAIEGNVIYSKHSSAKQIGISVITPYADDFSKNGNVKNNIVYLEENANASSTGMYFSRTLHNNPNLSMDSNWGKLLAGNEYYIGGTYYQRTDLEGFGLEQTKLVVDPTFAAYKPMDPEAIALLQAIYQKNSLINTPDTDPPLTPQNVRMF